MPRAITKAYLDVLDKRRQSRFGGTPLSVCRACPQVLFCKKPITKLTDVHQSVSLGLVMGSWYDGFATATQSATPPLTWKTGEPSWSMAQPCSLPT